MAYSASLQQKELDHNGMKRSYYLYQEKNNNTKSNMPLLIVLHGGGKSDGRSVDKYLGFTTIASQDDAVIVYPNGINGHWNDGRGITYRGKNNPEIDDVGFINQLIDTLIKQYKVDPQQVFISGISNGGMMSFRLACELSEKITAIAPIAANMPKNILSTCQPKDHLSVLLMNGTKDPIVPWQGGSVHLFRKTMGTVLSTKQSIDFWLARNQCQPKAKTIKLPNKVKKDGSRVELSQYSSCKNNKQVYLYSIIGGGHTLPGSKIPERKFLSGRKNLDIDGAQVIWDFFISKK